LLDSIKVMFNLCREYNWELIIKTAEHTKDSGELIIYKLFWFAWYCGTVCLLSAINKYSIHVQWFISVIDISRAYRKSVFNGSTFTVQLVFKLIALGHWLQLGINCQGFSWCYWFVYVVLNDLKQILLLFFIACQSWVELMIQRNPAFGMVVDDSDRLDKPLLSNVIWDLDEVDGH